MTVSTHSQPVRDRRRHRRGVPRQYLMCPPTYFRVEYSLNPWMNPADSVDPSRALAQWEHLRDLYRRLGHTVHTLVPHPDLPDMVFTANGATVIGGRALVARFRHPERAAEAAAYLDWLPAAGFNDVRQAAFINEGEGDYLLAGGRILAGAGFRSDPRGRDEIRKHLGRRVTGLTLVDPRFYHLDTALAVLDARHVMYYPGAFSDASRAVLEQLYPDAIRATEEDAVAFGLNAVSDGRHVVLPSAARTLIGQIRRRGYQPIGVDVSELIKAGGAVKCCTLELRGDRS